MPNPIRFNRRRRDYDTSSFKYYKFDVNYGEPDVFTYYFKARSSSDVARATGVELSCISECSDTEIAIAIRHHKHIDIVINGRLIDRDAE